jgi:multiple sugar transport system ATP-binding protein
MSDLDAKLKAELRVEVQRLHQELDTTVVYVTHDQTEAMTMSDHVVLLNEGRLEQFDSPRELFDHPSSEYTARFIGTPSTNVFEATVEDTEQGPVAVGQGARIRLPGNSLKAQVGRTVKLGIRPQYVTPGSGENDLELTVEVVEPLGTESVVHARTEDGTAFDVVTDDIEGCEAGETVRVSFDTSDIYVFDEQGDTILFGSELATMEESV